MAHASRAGLSRRAPTGRLHLLPLLLLGLSLGLAASAPAQTFDDPGFSSEVVVALPSFQPVGIAWAPDGGMFIWQRNGVVRIYHDGVLHPAPFIDISNRVNTFNDRGLLGLALDPDFEQNGYVYLGYTYDPDGDPNDPGPKTSRISRVTANPANPDVALPGSEVVLIGGIPDDGTTHTVGTLAFAPDGTLFVSNGDGASPNFADALAIGAQDLDSYRGKILRINPDGSAPAPPQATNPFYDGTNSIRSRVWAYGLRNPYRFEFHPTLGDLYSIDVGWHAWEEVDRVAPGQNYGWPCYEGVDPQPDYQSLLPVACSALPPSSVIPPLHTYPHSEGTCITSGAFATGTAYPPEYTNNFFFSDYSGQWIRRLVLDPEGSIAQNLRFATDAGTLTSMRTGPDGLLYVTEFLSGEIRRIRYAGVSAVASATPTSGYSPLPVSFSSAGSSDGFGGSLTYLWDFGDGASSTQANPTHSYVSAVVQTFDATLTVRNLAGNTSVASVPVTVGSLPPDPVISAPLDGTGVEPGQLVFYSGSATDPDEGVLPASALQWEVRLNHNTHAHPSSTGSGATGSFTAEYHGVVGTFSYDVRLTASDSTGLQTTTSVNLPVLPDTTAPSTPQNLIATALGPWTINLSWEASTDNATISAYRVERCLGATCSSFAEIAASTSNSHQDFGLSPSTAYRYRVRAEDPSGNLSGYSNPAAATTSAGPPQNPGLVAAWGLDEGSGTSVFDVSGSGNAGSISGATWAAGRYGQALAFDGANDVVVVPDSNSLDLSSAMTLEAWVRPTSTLSSWKAVVQKQADAFHLLGSTPGNRPGVGGTFNGACCTILAGPSALPVNQWTHLAGSYDGAQLRLYINGVLVANQARTGSLEVNAFPLRIGGNTYGGEFFPGLIDEVRIYDRALSAAEIFQDMNTPVGSVPSDTTPPLRSNGLPTGVLSAGTTQTTLSLATDEAATCRYGTTPGTAYSSMPSSFSTSGGTAHSTTVSGLANGQTYSFYVRCEDAAPTPNANPDDLTISFFVADPSDTTAPTATLTQPTDGAQVSGTITLSATAFDNSGVVSGVQFLLDGNNLGAEDTTAPYELIWDTHTATNGNHILAARARDGSSNTGTSANSSVTVNNPVPTGLVAAWGLNEGSGASVSDASSNGNAGSISGATWATGRYGPGLSFDGANDVVVVPDSNSLDLNSAMTLEAWVRPTSTLSNWKAILQKQVDAYHLMANTSSNRAGFGGTFNGVCCTILEGPSALPVNQWSHLAGSYDGAQLRLYINGVQVANQARTGSLEVNALPLRIGGNTYGGEFFPGLIDEVRIYDRALSAEEIIQDMNTPVGSVPSDATPPLRSNGLPTGVLAAGTTQTTLSLTTDEAATCRYGTSPGTAYASMPSSFSTSGGTAHSTTVSGLANGQVYSFYVRCQDAAPTPNTNPDDLTLSFSVASDTTPPLRSNGLPTGALAAGTTQTTLSLTTEEAATCRYGISPGVAYASMPSAFSTTGGTAHSTTVSGLANGQTYSFYVRCQDAAPTPNTNPDDFAISFSVAFDTTPPLRSNGLPTGVLAAGTTQTTLSLTTDEAATCRYGTTPGTAYASMPSAFSTSGGTAHSTPVTGLANGQTYSFFVRCQDAAPTPNTNPDDLTITFSVAAAATPWGCGIGPELLLLAPLLAATRRRKS